MNAMILATFAGVATSALAQKKKKKKKKKKRPEPYQFPPENKALMERLEMDFARIANCPDTSFRVIGAWAEKTGPSIKLRAQVQMTWPPGRRRRFETAIGSDENSAYSILLGNLVKAFHQPNPGCVKLA